MSEIDINTKLLDIIAEVAVYIHKTKVYIDKESGVWLSNEM